MERTKQAVKKQTPHQELIQKVTKIGSEKHSKSVKKFGKFFTELFQNIDIKAHKISSWKSK